MRYSFLTAWLLVLATVTFTALAAPAPIADALTSRALSSRKWPTSARRVLHPRRQLTDVLQHLTEPAPTALAPVQTPASLITMIVKAVLVATAELPGAQMEQMLTAI